MNIFISKIKELLSKVKNLINKMTSKLGDKKMHVLCGFISTLLIGLLFNVVTGVMIGCIVSLAKEMYDEVLYRQGDDIEGFNKSDLAYSILGVVIAAIILIII